MNLSEQMGSHLTGLEQLRIMMERNIRPGMAETLDIRLVEVEEGRVVVESVPGEQHYNPAGVVQGGFAATMLDFACGYVTLSRLGQGVRFTTLELKVAYHRAMTAATGTVRAEGTIASLSRRTAFTEARLIDERGKLLASATSSLLVIRPS